MSRKKDFLKNLIILAFGSIMPKAAQLIMLPIITGGLSQIEYGTYDLVVSMVSLLVPIATLQVQTATFRFLLDCRDNKQESERIISNVLAFVLPVATLIIIVLFLGLRNFALKIRIVICIYYYVEILLRTFQQIARGIGKNTLYSSSAVMESLIQLFLVIVFIMFCKNGLLGALLAIAVADTIAVCMLVLKMKIWKCINFSLCSLNSLKVMLKYSWPMVPNCLSTWVLSSSDKLVLTYFIGVEATAIYAVATKIPLMLTTVQSAYALAWQENASIASSDDDAGKYYSEMFDTTYGFIVGLFALLVAVTPILFILLIKGDYQEAYPHIFILYMGTFFNCIMTFMGGIYIAHKQTLSVGVTSVCGAIINLIVDLVLVSKIGIYAASISTLVSFLFMATFRMIDVQKFQKIHYPIKKMIYSICVSSIMCILAAQNNWMFNCINGCIGIVFAICMNRNVIKNLVIQIKRKFSYKGEK